MSKLDGSKVMTFVHKKPLLDMTYGKNYNVKESFSGFYSCIDDVGIERKITKRAFNHPLVYLSELQADNFIDGKPDQIGFKQDAEKLKPTLLINDMPLAINEVLKVLKFGAEKYSEGNWLKVEDGINRYRNAGLRHLLAVEELDDESGLSHLSHAVTSLLMELELRLREGNAK